MTSFKHNILTNIGNLIDQQNAKGLEKYNHKLEDCPVNKYDWQHMMMEELIDALQYQQKEIQRINTDKNIIFKDILQERLRQNDLHPEQLPLSMRYVTIMEEAGEVAEALQEKDLESMYRELIDMAACCVRMAEDVLRESEGND